MEIFMKRQTYDVALKLSVANEYETGNETYTTLAGKHNIPRPTVASWIRKARSCSTLPSEDNNIQPSFLNVTPRLQALKEPVHQDEVVLRINGFEIKGDLLIITKLLLGAKNV